MVVQSPSPRMSDLLLSYWMTTPSLLRGSWCLFSHPNPFFYVPPAPCSAHQRVVSSRCWVYTELAGIPTARSRGKRNSPPSALSARSDSRYQTLQLCKQIKCALSIMHDIIPLYIFWSSFRSIGPLHMISMHPEHLSMVKDYVWNQCREKCL